MAQKWYVYESTEELREECRSGEFVNRIHPEFESKSFPPNPDGAQAPGSIFAVDMGSSYQALVDRGVELEKELCHAGGGQIPQSLPQPPDVIAKARELSGIKTEFEKRRQEQMPSGSHEPEKAKRVYMDMFRLLGSCGHGTG